MYCGQSDSVMFQTSLPRIAPWFYFRYLAVVMATKPFGSRYNKKKLCRSYIGVYVSGWHLAAVNVELSAPL